MYLEEVYGKVPPPTTETTSALGKKDETGVSVLKTISPTGKAVFFCERYDYYFCSDL